MSDPTQQPSTKTLFERYRPYRQARRAASLAQLLAELRKLEDVALDSYVEGLDTAGGGLWALWRGEEALAVAAVDGLPGLPDLYEISGGVAPRWRRQGLGSYLWAQLTAVLPALGIRHLECLQSSQVAGAFLAGLGFYFGHKELLLELEMADQVADFELPTGLSLRTLTQSKAVAQFRALYEQSFHGLPWYQPYEDEAAVRAWLDHAADILFLYDGERPVGFAWLQADWAAPSGQLEPIGLIPPFQGQGWGRHLLVAALHEAGRRGWRRAEIGVWQENTAALNLYRSAGFAVSGERSFWRYDLAG